MNNKDENQKCSNGDAEVEKALSLKKFNNAEQHFVLTNKRAKSMKLSGNTNKKQRRIFNLKPAEEGIRPLHSFLTKAPCTRRRVGPK